MNPTLSQYVTHARRFGVECVYETAEELNLPQLGLLPAHLRRIDSAWELQPDQRSRLIGNLIESGAKQQVIADTVGISLSSVEKIAAQLRNPVPENRMVEPSKPVKSAALNV